MSALILISVLGALMLYLGIYGRKNLLAPAGIVGLLGAIALLATGWHIPHGLLAGMLEFDRLATGFSIGMAAITALIFLFGPDYYQRKQWHVAEQYALMLFSLVGGILLASWTNLLMLFLGVEVLSIPLYVLAGGKKRSLRSSEASLKYFLLGSFATAFLLMGITLLYGLTGSFDMGKLGAFMAAQAAPHMMLNFGLFFVVAGLAFKVGAVPFHFWKPDVYQGAPTLVTTFMATVVMMGAIAGFHRFTAVTGMPDALAHTMALLVLATLLVGNLSALRQTNFKRLMAYSSVSHSGFLLLALLSNGPTVGTTLLYYTFTYALASVGLFILFTVAKRANHGAEHNGIFKGLFAAKPWTALCALVLLLSLAGIPLTAGFIAKYQVFLLAIGAGWLKLMGFGVLMALLGIYYYVMVARELFLPAEQPVTFSLAPLNGLAVALCTAAVLALGLWPHLPF
ncbi:MAG: NADH-quinone oxidoreductase subunit N [Flavobacteriales bacterium]|nr:NADH-quinone oxidoreductase subunit N [Flavobacteriales bacterium]MBP9080817.1 NADH-quinone oxidoreductase subunit N [Flavobacteriales bacterium]